MDKPTVDDSHRDDSHRDDSHRDDPTMDDPNMDNLTLEKIFGKERWEEILNGLHEPTIQQPTMDPQRLEKLSHDELWEELLPATDEPAMDKATMDEPALEEGTRDEPTMYKSPTIENEPTVKNSTMENSTAHDSTAHDSTAKQPTTNKLAMDPDRLLKMSDKELWEEVLTAERQMVLEAWYKKAVETETHWAKNAKPPGRGLPSANEATGEGVRTKQAKPINDLDGAMMGLCLSNGLQQGKDQRPRLLPPKSIYRPISQIAASDVPSLHKMAYDLTHEDPRSMAALMVALATNDHSNLARSMLTDSYAELLENGRDMNKTTERHQNKYDNTKSIGSISKATLETINMTRKQYQHVYPGEAPIPLIRSSMENTAGEFESLEQSFETTISALENLCKIGNAILVAAPDSLGAEMREVFRKRGGGYLLPKSMLKVLKSIPPEQVVRAAHNLSEADNEMLLSKIRRLSVQWGICGLDVEAGFAKVIDLLEHGAPP